ncbi:MAG: MBL fold metallo-hydrolase, partial [Chloroflexota bacterium]|nr:MBL fold metallo-hydrolase [Chloroflexota bacterium]
LPELRQHVGMAALDAIIISHMHIDHMLDIFALWWGWLYNPVPLPKPLPLWLPPGGRDALLATARTLSGPDEVAQLCTRVFDVHEYNPDNALTIGSATARFRSTLHYIPCWAIRVIGTDGRSLVYTADNGDAAGLVPFATDANILIAEALLPVAPADPDAERGTSTAAEVAALAHDAAVQTLVLTHIWAEHDAEASRTQARSIFHGRIEVAQPGLTITA